MNVTTPGAQRTGVVSGTKPGSGTGEVHLPPTSLERRYISAARSGCPLRS